MQILCTMNFSDLIKSKTGPNDCGIQEKIKTENAKFNEILKLFDVKSDNLKVNGDYAFTPDDQCFISMLLDEYTMPYFKMIRNDDYSGVTIGKLTEIVTGFKHVMINAGKSLDTIEKQICQIQAKTYIAYMKLINDLKIDSFRIQKYFEEFPQKIYILPMQYKQTLLSNLEADFNDFFKKYRYKWDYISSVMRENYESALLNLRVDIDPPESDDETLNNVILVYDQLESNTEFKKLLSIRDTLVDDKRLTARGELLKVQSRIDSIILRTENDVKMKTNEISRKSYETYFQRYSHLCDKHEDAFSEACDEYSSRLRSNSDGKT